ncbi:MAG TPA: DUF3341 domain-containing protein [Steroidobacteraceae bacterium]|nr:DUF3341 domain-containing protein [Steroidobacteraceae bacterium]
MADYGVSGEFADAASLVGAIRAARAAGWERIEAFTPFPVDEVIEALPAVRDRIPLFTLCGGILGGAGGYFMQWYSATQSYPINVGGRPLHSWPSFIPITFELAVLGAALAAVFGMLWLNRLPSLRHPMFDVADFDCASRNRFFICIRGGDAKFDAPRVRALLAEQGAQHIADVENEP